MKGITVEPSIIADDELLDIIFATHLEDYVGMVCESAARAVCRALALAANRVGVSADALFNTRLELKMHFKKPTVSDFENGDAFWEEE